MLHALNISTIVRLDRLPFMLLAFAALTTGMITGLQRMGWQFPITSAVSHHGAIMVGGFLGTLITLEKIIPLKRKMLLLLPLLSGASVVAFFSALPVAAFVLLTTASLGLCFVFAIYLHRERSLVYAMMLGGALCWTTGNILLGWHRSYPLALPWWMSFAYLIILAERLELMKFLPVSAGQKRAFILFVTLFVVSCFTSFHGIGGKVAAVSLLLSSTWLMRFDVVAINLKKNGLQKFVGISLLTGYFALIVSAVLILLLADAPLGYDMLVHAFFIGFVFSMIFAHGPIILPGVLGVSLKPYHPILYVWLTVLHLSWFVRVLSDTMLNISWRQYAGLLSALAMVGYFTSLATILVRSYRVKNI